MRTIASVVAALVAGATALPAQAPPIKPEIRPFMGAYIPTGGQRDLFRDAAIFGVQAALELKPNLHLLGTFGWVPGQNKYGETTDNVSILTYDVGVELSFTRALAGDWTVRPFVGLGGGARSYAYESNQLSDKACAAGYGALGSEFQLGQTALRLEARDNVFCYKSPITGVESKTRNDVGLAFGISYHLR